VSCDLREAECSTGATSKCFRSNLKHFGQEKIAVAETGSRPFKSP
jgi:hypothetical protein